MEKMSGQLHQAQTPVLHSKLCTRRGFLSAQSAYSHAARWVETRAKRKIVRPAEKLNHKGARHSCRATSETQDKSESTSTDGLDTKDIARRSQLVREVAYLQDLVETLRKALTAQAKVSLHSV